MKDVYEGAVAALNDAQSQEREAIAWRPPTGDEIRSLRNKLGLSQLEFAKRFHLEVGTLRNWEQGRSVPEAASRTLLWMIDADPVGALNLLYKAHKKELEYSS